MKRLTGTLLALLLTATLAPAQTPAHPMDEQGCAMMKASAADDAKLKGMLEDMNKAQGQAKIDKMAAVINELMAQRSAMHSGAGCCSMMKKDAAKTGASCCSATASCCNPASSCCSTAKKESTSASMECH